ncbi:hypothetical protein ABL78_4932 [Leptomonas seymouri]|uniref:Uncharacterized protein n=1 Tax=Leptomonas seymouri TaxID=5684 RepID=A0A0N0P534_LEPSE|nr:hypothetical protein ABL78_4932 [Leptomonas seymouri]|eukprot:KPI85999.1 hypothetical protein ABL78_4932 [Leptomonas seymouri]
MRRCIRQRQLLRRLPLLTAGVLLCLLLLDSPCFRGAVSVRAATATDQTTSPLDTGRTPNAESTFNSLTELNQHVFGAPHSFHPATSSGKANDREGGGSGGDTGYYGSAATAAVTERETEVAEALALHKALVSSKSYAPENPEVTAASGEDARSTAPSPRLYNRGDFAEVNMSAASMCSADFTCPQSSMVWASGSFTGTGVLTPHSLTLPVGLQLRFSLCCQYKFDGTLLRSHELYDAFLQELLQASPFQVLSAAEKRQLFPQHRVFIVDTRGKGRVYNSSSTLTEEDVANHNDGDGDVLVLTTGLLSPAALQSILSSAPALAYSGSSGSTDGNDDAPAHNSLGGGGTRNKLDTRATTTGDAEKSLPGVDVQLRITNRVLKCKCPHILNVMPLLHVRRDALPPISISGLGSHCGVQPSQNATKRSSVSASGDAPMPRPRIHRARRADGTEAFAASFELMQRLPPTTLVSWTVRQVAEDEQRNEKDSLSSASSTTVLRHTRLLPIVMDGSGRVQYSSAASPFFFIDADVRYEVSVTVSRGPLSSNISFQTAEGRGEADRGGSDGRRSAGVRHLHITRRAHGRFVLRLPLNRSWDLPPVHPDPHFGFHRFMKLANATLSRAEVAAALNPRFHPSSRSSSFASGSEGEPSSGGAGWFGLGRWTGSGSVSSTRNRTLSYYGYWEHIPLQDQLLPQRAVHVPSNPFTDPVLEGVPVPLFIGRNLLAYVVRDVDDVCDPVVLEGREIWAVQSVVQTPGPVTACAEQTDVSALVLRELYLRMRSEPKIAVTVPKTSWSTDRTRPAEVASEGSYRCSALDADSGTAVPPCVATPSSERDGSECFASLHMSHRGVHEVVWVVRVAVRDARLVTPESLDPLYASVVKAANPADMSSDAATVVVEVRSRPLLVVRRQASYPAVVKVELPMHARHWTVTAPHIHPAPVRASFAGRTRGGGSHSGRRVHDVLSDNTPTGHWRSRWPIRVLSVDERLTAELDTNDVPNTQRMLPRGTLEFVAEDSGEVLSLPTLTSDAERALSYTAKCPDTVVEYELHVVAFPPPPVTPVYAPVYTEEDCVVLVPPRAVRKDEVAEWRVPPCAAAAGSGGRAPYLVERTLSVEEQEEHAYVTTLGDGGEPLLSHTQTVNASSRSSTLTTASTATVTRQALTALMACGVGVYQRCDVVWSVRNLVAEVRKTYSLRRCQRPPEVLFHEDNRQRRVSYPPSGVFELPTLQETAYVPVSATPANSGVEGAAVNATALMSRQRRQRHVIPIAGYRSTMGYSFNYTGLQEHFEIHLHPLPDTVAHQLVNTRHDYVEAKDGSMVLRRHTLTDLQLPPDQQQQQQHAAAWEAMRTDGPNSDSFWSEYQPNRATTATTGTEGGAPTSSTTPSIEFEARVQQERLRVQQRSRQIDEALGKTYIVVHEGQARRLRVADVGNSSLFSMDYVVRGSAAARNAEAEEDHREFRRRGMCVERPGYLAVLAVNPRGSVTEDERCGTILPAPPAPAVAVLPFCAPHYTFARYPELSSVYGYEYTWTCPERDIITVRKHHPTYSVLSHTPAAALKSKARHEALCELAVINHITQTEQRDWFLVRRVYPSPLPPTALAVLSDNAADSLRIVTTVPSPRQRGSQGRSEAMSRTPTSNGTRAVVTMEELYRAPANTYPFTKARRVVGKSVVLHVDAPSETGKAQWAVSSIVPATTTSVGTQVLMSEVQFQKLYRHPAALARGRGGSTVLVKGLRTPGLYTLTHTLPDPENPSVCPPVTLTEMLDVFHARVLEKELYVCGDTAALQAVPIPREMAHEFIGQWEVLSLATDEETVWTDGANLAGIRFERGRRAETLVHGLPFGVVTMRWAIYRRLPSSKHLADDLGDPSAVSGSGRAHPDGGTGASATTAAQQHVLVDYDTVEVFVMTENLPSHRLVTLADQVTILTTSSTKNWKLVDVVSGLGDGTRAGGSAFENLRLSHSTFANSTQSSIHPFVEVMDSGKAQETVLQAYYGLHPRPGSGALTLHHLPVGTVHLRYDVVPSQSVFGKMIGHTCALQGHYDVERVSAYLTATTSLDHECDGYTGRGRITLCLHTEGVGMTKGGTPGSGSAKGQRHDAQAQTPPHALFWQSQVRLAAPETLEDIIKRGAREVEQLSRGRCATPWWVARSTRWLNISYTSSLTAPKAVGPVGLSGRCVSFIVKAGRHLSPREASQPLFMAVPRALASAVGGVGPGGVDRESRHSGSTSATCPFHGDFISTRVIDGTPLVETGAVRKASAATPSAAGSPSSSSSGLFFGLSQLFQLGLPHTIGRGERGASSGDYDGAWGIHFMPVLQSSSLRRVNTTMRPMVGLRGALDDVTTELNISGLGSAWRHGEYRDEHGKEDVAATVLLRLDLTNAKHAGGFTVFASDQEARELDAASSSLFTTAPPPPLPVPHQSLLYKCVVGTVRGSDVLQYWSETNRPDGRVDRTAQEWLDYVYAVRDAPVACDVLFASLDHLLSETYDPSYSAPQHTSSGGSSMSRRALSKPSQQQRQKPRYISLTQMEQQVERIRKQYRWTSDGIDVTDLPVGLQRALSHRRVTTTQLRAIEAARRARQAAEEARAAEQQRTKQEPENAPSQSTPMERLTSALRAYQGVAQGGEAAVLRIQLPLHEAFATPYDLFIRTALHKDVLCGTSVDPPPALRTPTAQPVVMNPYSLVPLGRLEIRDSPPALSLYPPVVKQCEVEGGLPVLTFELTGASFAQDRFSAEEVLLEEVPNPLLVESGHAQQSPDVGLGVCLAEMRRNLNAVIEEGSHKRLYLQLNACPSFKMLTPEEYNEYQDSEGLLRRLQFSRYLRVTVRRAIRPDSFLSDRAAAAVRRGGVSISADGRVDDTWAASQNLSSSTVTPTSTDASFIVEVRPTLARLHLRSTAATELSPGADIAGRLLGRHGNSGNRQDAAQRLGVSNGGAERGSSWWGGAAKRSRETQQGIAISGGDAATAADDSTAFSFAPTPSRPLLLCETNLHDHGFQLGIELIGDTWTKSVGDEGAPATTYSRASGRREHTTLPRPRAPPNVALINSFSVVEHHGLDSSHHLYMKGGGVYRSHFIYHLFTEVRRNKARVHRYNDTFASIVFPPLPAASTHHAESLPSAFATAEEEEADFYVAQQQQWRRQQRLGQRYVAESGATHTASASAGVVLPAVRPFCKVEEILFAVPGIATECRGCLLADTTFFVAGDLTGVWSLPTSVAPSDASAWSSEAFTRPLVVPWDSVASIPREWSFEWVCPYAAHRALERWALQFSGTDATALSIVMDIVLYRVRGLNGEELPAQQRPTVVLSSQRVPLTDALERNRAASRQYASQASSAYVEQSVPAVPLRLRVSESVAGAAYTRLTDDVLRYRRHARTTMEYHRDGRYAKGLLAVNASVFLQVCAGVQKGDAGHAACTVVSITDALLTVESPKTILPWTSRLYRALRLGSGTARAKEDGSSTSARASSPLSPAVLLHHAFISYLCYELLPLLGIVTLEHNARGSSGSASKSESFIEDQERAHVAYTVMAFVFLFFSYAYAPIVWTLLCLMVWSLSLYHSRRPDLIFLFVASVLYTHYLM